MKFIGTDEVHRSLGQGMLFLQFINFIKFIGFITFIQIVRFVSSHTCTMTYI